MILKTSVIHRKGAKSAKDAKKIKDLSELPEGFVIHLLGEWAKVSKLLFPLRSLYLRAFAVRILGSNYSRTLRTTSMMDPSRYSMRPTTLSSNSTGRGMPVTA